MKTRVELVIGLGEAPFFFFFFFLSFVVDTDSGLGYSIGVRAVFCSVIVG